MATLSPIRDEEASAVFVSPSFTPRNREKPLPPINQADTLLQSSAFIHAPISWYTPSMESPLQEKSLLEIFPTSGEKMERKANVSSREGRMEESGEEWEQERSRLHSFSESSESPVSRSSSSQLYSTRLSCSTMTSSATRSESSATTSPQAYGFALGSPNIEAGERIAQKAQIAPVGLGLTDDQHVSRTSGPYSHHRTPSWTLQNLSNNMKASFPNTTRSVLESYDSISLGSGRLPLEFAVPTRFASRSRTNSIASSKIRRNLSTDEVPTFSTRRPSTARSMSTNSIESSTADSILSQPSPRSSSLRKSKSRPRLNTKASEPTFTLQKGLSQSAAVSRAKAGSVGEAHARFNGWTLDRAANASSSTMRDLDDYLVYTGEGALDSSFPSPLALTVAEEGQGVFVIADGKTLSEIELECGPKTTHLLLFGCQEEGLIDFLERTLPIVAANLLVLDVSKTSLTHLPNSLLHCTNLEELNISFNSLSRPWKGTVLSKLVHLRVLLADSCQLTLLPCEMGSVQNLTTLSLRHNHLSHLPSWLHRLSHLEQLFLEGNPFQGSWQQVCGAFLATLSEPQSTISSSSNPRPMMERAPASAPSRMIQNETLCTPSTHELSFEEFEEMIDGVSPTAAHHHVNKSKEEKLIRPLMRRMMSVTNDSGREEDGSILLSSRRPSNESMENKWEILKKKLSRKASTSQVSVSSIFLDNARRSESISPLQSRSNSISQHQRTKLTTPLTPVGWQDASSNVSSWSKIANPSKRTSFLAISQDNLQQSNRRRLRALLQYLKDLEDLKAIRVGPPGTLLPMETSMASQYSSPTKSLNSMNRSGSETSGESTHSNSTSSCQSTREQGVNPIAFSSQSTKDDALRRIHILKEIVTTEETYVRGLKELVDIYVVPSGVLDPTSGQQAIPAVERRNVFGNIEGIYHFHQFAFLPALQDVMQAIVEFEQMDREKENKDLKACNAMSATLTEQMANVFTKHAAYFRMYSAYVNNVDSAQKRVTQWRLPKTTEMNQAAIMEANTPLPLLMNPKERKRIKSFLTKARRDSRHSQLSLETYLHLPVQRIPRYRLLFEDLVRSCPSHRLLDPNAISKALDSICSVATLMNENKRQSENDRKLLEWQARIRGHFASPLLQPHRKLIKDGGLTLKRVVMRTTAFHMAKSQWSQEEMETNIIYDGSVTDTELGIVQIDCLDQQCMEQQVKVLLCNDITVIVIQDSIQQGPTSPVDLFAVLRIQSPVQIVGQTSE